MEKDNKLQYIVLGVDLLVLFMVTTVFFHFMNTFFHATVAHISWYPNIIYFILAFLLAFSILPPVSHERMATSEDVTKRSLLTSALFILFYTFIVIAITPSNRFPRTFTYAFALIFAAMNLCERLLLRKWFMRARAEKHDLRHVVLIGNDENMVSIYKYLSPSVHGYTIAGVFFDEEMEGSPLNALRRGKRSDALEWLAQHPEVHEVYAHFADSEREQTHLLAEFCDNHLMRLYFVPNIHVFCEKAEFQQMGSTMIIARSGEPLTLLSNRAIKRAFDLAMSSLFLATLYPLIYIVVAIIIKRQSPGPVYFKQERTGLDGNVFTCLKFRSMNVNADADKLQATRDDPRKFPFGNIMRKTNIDELPQLINVWKGDMSLVGPRPHMLKHTEEYSHIVNRYMVRHFAKPGITGLAQVSGFRGETKHIEDMEGRVRKDIEYIENWTFLLDLKIILKTFTNMLGGEKNAY